MTPTRSTYRFDVEGHTVVTPEVECQNTSPLNESWMGRRFCNHKKAPGACDFCNDLRKDGICPRGIK
jgi:hypothetical protein